LSLDNILNVGCEYEKSKLTGLFFYLEFIDYEFDSDTFIKKCSLQYF